MKRLLIVTLVALNFTTGCATVAPWERDVLALPAMELDDSPCIRFERNAEVYREGAVGANGGKSGGGCGCS
jgi:hypothetical protein